MHNIFRVSGMFVWLIVLLLFSTSSFSKPPVNIDKATELGSIDIEVDNVILTDIVFSEFYIVAEEATLFGKIEHPGNYNGIEHPDGLMRTSFINDMNCCEFKFVIKNDKSDKLYSGKLYSGNIKYIKSSGRIFTLNVLKLPMVSA